MIQCRMCERDFDPYEGVYRLNMTAPGWLNTLDDNPMWFCQYACLKGWID